MSVVTYRVPNAEITCNTSFQTELIYRPRKRGQKSGNLSPLGRGWSGTGRLKGEGGGVFISDLARAGRGKWGVDSQSLSKPMGKPRVSAAAIWGMKYAEEKSRSGNYLLSPC